MKKIVIFGAGNNAYNVSKKLRENGYLISAIIDNDSNKWGLEIDDIIISSPSDVIKGDKSEILVVISVYNEDAKKDIITQLESKGLVLGKNIVDGCEFAWGDMIQSGRVSGNVQNADNFTAIKTFDPASRLYVLKDDRRIFRAVNPAYVNEYLKVYELCKSNHLFDRFIVNTEVCNDTMGIDCGILLEHEFIEPVTYCFEWSPKAFRDYVVFMTELIEAIDGAGLSMCDGHALNVTMVNNDFKLIDFGAIQSGMFSRSVLLEFFNTHLIPLLLISKNVIDKAYLYMKNAGLKYTLSDIRGYFTDDEFTSIYDMYADILLVESCGVTSYIKKVRDFIDNLNFKKEKTRWDGYQDDEWNWSDREADWSDKMKSFVELIEKVNPCTLCDLAGNMGWYGSYKSDSMKWAVVLDYDYMCIDALWDKVRIKNKKNVYPIYMSLCAPTLDYYRDDAIGKTGVVPWRSGAITRFKADLVVALAIIHHLAFAQQLTFEEILNQFSMFTSKYLIVEFIEQDDRYITDFLKAGFEWYTRANFEKVLLKDYNIIDTKPSTPKETRVIYLCEKK